jgi:2-phospho-L-lactate guanylyltransferase (CobY/MobA/RfbA family)
VGALRQAGIERVLVSADEPAVIDRAKQLGAEICPPAQGPSESVAKAFERTGAPLIVTTADHALLEARWVSELVAKTPSDADLSVMMARRSDIERALPETQRTYLRFADGEWSGCNLFYLATPRAEAALASWRAVEADRKRPWKLVARLGLGNLFSYAIGRLTLADALARLGRRIGLEARLVAASDGRAAIDVDKMRDLDDVRRLLDQDGERR